MRLKIKSSRIVKIFRKYIKKRCKTMLPVVFDKHFRQHKLKICLLSHKFLFRKKKRKLLSKVIPKIYQNQPVLKIYKLMKDDKIHHKPSQIDILSPIFQNKVWKGL